MHRINLLPGLPSPLERVAAERVCRARVVVLHDGSGEGCIPQAGGETALEGR